MPERVFYLLTSKTFRSELRARPLLFALYLLCSTAILGLIFGVAAVSASIGLGEVDTVDTDFLTGDRYDGEVLDGVIQSDGKIVIVGKFKQIVGSPRAHVARLNPDGTFDPTFDPGLGANSYINAIGLLADGRIVVAGTFTTFDGLPAGRIAVLLPDGSVDASFQTGTGISGTIHDLHVQPGDKIVICGDFHFVNGTSATRIARLNQDGSFDPTFHIGAGANASVRVIESRPDGRLLVGGDFSQIQGLFRSWIAQLGPNGNIDSGFSSAGPTERVVAIGFQTDGKILVGGDFGLRRMNSGGGLDTSLSTPEILDVTAIAVQADNKMVLGGQFPRELMGPASLIRLLPNGSEDKGSARGESDPIYKIRIVSAGEILLLGYMDQFDDSIGGASKTGAKKFDDSGVIIDEFVTRHGAADSTVLGVVLRPDGKIVVRGDFIKLGGVTRPKFGRLYKNGTFDEEFAPSVDPTAFAAMADGTIIVGGVETEDNYIFRFHRILENGSIDPSFEAVSEGVLGSLSTNVEDMLGLPDGKVIAVGSFAKINGVNRNGIARLNADGSLDTSFNPFFNRSGQYRITKVVLKPDGNILVSGKIGVFYELFQLTPDGNFDPTFASFSPDQRYLDVFPMENGQVLVAGVFSSIAGTPVNDVARLHVNGSVDLTFNAPEFDSPGSGAVWSVIDTADNKVLIGGMFSNIGGVQRRAFARLNADGTLDTSYEVTIGDSLSVIYDFVRESDGNVIGVGSFNGSGNLYKRRVIRIFGEPSEDASAPAPFDFDGDGATDVSVFRPDSQPTAQWWLLRSSDSGTRGLAFGTSTDLPVAADYTGDGKADVAFWRPSTGEWFILRSEDDSFFAFPFGANGDIPAPGDFDGDGKADPAVYRPSSGTWFIVRSSDGGLSVVPFGVSADQPIVADYDGDGKDDVGIYRAPDNQFWLLRSTDGVKAFQFGAPGDRTAVGDWTGDGKADVAFFRPSSSEWYVIRSEDDSFFAFPWGATGDIPSPGDFDGDGKFDPAVWRPSDRTWYIFGTTSGFEAVQFGSPGDVPLPSSVTVQ